MLKLAILLKFWVQANSEVSLSRTVSTKMCVLDPFFSEKIIVFIWPISTKWSTPRVLHRWKDPNTPFLMVKICCFFSSSCEWSGFRGRPRTDILHNMRLRRRFIAIQIHKHIYIIQHTTPKVLAFDHYIQAVTMAYMGLVMVVVVMVMMVTMAYMTTLSK